MRDVGTEIADCSDILSDEPVRCAEGNGGGRVVSSTMVGGIVFRKSLRTGGTGGRRLTISSMLLDGGRFGRFGSTATLDLVVDRLDPPVDGILAVVF